MFRRTLKSLTIASVFGHKEGNIFESQNAITVVQTSKVKFDGYCGFQTHSCIAKNLNF